jgi:hypothetical protein
MVEEDSKDLLVLLAREDLREVFCALEDQSVFWA